MIRDNYPFEKEIKLFPYEGLSPNINESVFLAPGVKIIGDVNIGKYSSIWYNSVLRGDIEHINIGEMTNIQDSSMIHVTGGEFPVDIGNGVTVGHSVTLHGCTIKDFSLIGMNATILDGAIIEENSLVAAGSVVKPNFIVPSGKLVAGIPAKVIRDLRDDEIKSIIKSAKKYKKYAEISLKSLQTIKETQNEN